MSPVAARARNYDVNSRVRVDFAWGPGPGRTALRAQAASGRLTPAPGPGMGGALRFHQVLSDTSSPLRKLRTGLKQQRPVPGASSGQRSPAPDDGSSRPRPHAAPHRCPAHPWTGPVTRCPKKAARVTVRGAPVTVRGAPGSPGAGQAAGAERAFHEGVKEGTPTLAGAGGARALDIRLNPGSVRPQADASLLQASVSPRVGRSVVVPLGLK